MNCINCGAALSRSDREYCPHCGFHVQIQRRVEYLSGYYYNIGLEKASIRDLSGAINFLKQSLAYNKNNIDARNLLGLVYFETGEVVAALSEWVISKNLSPGRNLASDYIARLQSNQGRLDAINDTIRRYNHALELCREGHEDMAAIQLRRILAQNSKLIKGYHLLALIHMKNHEWGRARRILRKAAKIDKTNTTTLRFLKEVDERTGVITKLEDTKRRRFFGKKDTEDSIVELAGREQPAAVRERNGISLFMFFAFGAGAGALALWILAVPAMRQSIYRQANEQIVKYSEALSSQSAELSRAQGEAKQSGNSAEEIAAQAEEEKKKNESYRYLLTAYYYLQQGDPDTAAVNIQNVYRSYLSDELLTVYNTVCDRTGVYGPEDLNRENDDTSSGSDYSGGDYDYYDESESYGYDDYSDYDYYDYDYDYSGEW